MSEVFENWKYHYVPNRYIGHGCGPNQCGAIGGVTVTYEPEGRKARDIYIDVRQMHCCAMAELHGLGNTLWRMDWRDRGEYLRQLVEFLHTDAFFGGVVATCVDQQEHVPGALTDAGFEFQTRFYNPKSGNWVSLYVKTFPKPEEDLCEVVAELPEATRN